MSRIWIIVPALAVLVACGSPEPQGPAAAESTQTSTAAEPTQTPTAVEPAPTPTYACPDDIPITVEDPAIIWSLEERVEISPMIVIGRVEAEAGIVNTVRLEEAPTTPDPNDFGLGQVYRVNVEEYIRGSGPATLNVVNAEGYLPSRDGSPVELPESDAELDCIRAAYQSYLPLQVGERYLFFLQTAEYFDPDVEYAFTSLGHPWRYLLPEGGQGRPESPYQEANDAYPVMPSEEFVETVTALIAASR